MLRKKGTVSRKGLRMDVSRMGPRKNGNGIRINSRSFTSIHG